MVDLIAISNWVAANTFYFILILIAVLILKGLALYKAARKESIIWFWVILVFNTLGVLPILYLVFSRRAE